MGGRFFEGFHILFLAARRERHADMCSGTTSPLGQSGTHNTASPFAVSAVGMWRESLILQLKAPGEMAKDTVAPENVITKDGRPLH